MCVPALASATPNQSLGRLGKATTLPRPGGPDAQRGQQASGRAPSHGPGLLSCTEAWRTRCSRRGPRGGGWEQGAAPAPSLPHSPFLTSLPANPPYSAARGAALMTGAGGDGGAAVRHLCSISAGADLRERPPPPRMSGIRFHLPGRETVAPGGGQVLQSQKQEAGRPSEPGCRAWAAPAPQGQISAPLSAPAHSSLERAPGIPHWLCNSEASCSPILASPGRVSVDLPVLEGQCRPRGPV